MVTPPRVYLRSNHYYLKYYLPGRKRPIEKSTGLPAVTEETPTHLRKLIVEKLQQKIDKLAEDKTLVALGHRTVDLPSSKKPKSFSELLPLFNHANEKQRGYARTKSTLLHRENAVSFFEKRLPGLSPAHVDKESLYQLRDAALKEGVSPATIKGYITELRALQKFAIAEGYAKENPFLAVGVRIPRKKIVAYKRSDEFRLYRFLWNANRGQARRVEGWKILKAILVLRTTLIRSQDACNLRQEWFKDLSDHEFHYWNGKWRDWEPYRSSAALEEVLKWPADGEYVVHFRDEKTVYHYLQRACELAGVPIMSVHDLKRIAADELDALGYPDRVMTIALHHTPQGETSTMQRHYSRNKVQLLKMLNEAHHPLYEFLTTLSDLPPDPRPYSFSNPKSYSSQRKKHAQTKNAAKSGDSESNS